VLLHGDVHQWNTLQAGVDWKLVDPDGLLAEPEADLGVLMREETLGYGVNEIGSDCNPNRDYTGVSVGELVARCGEPASRRQAYDAIVNRPIPGYARWRDQRREDWVYDFGEDRFLRLVHLVDGRVVDIDVEPR